MNWDAIGAIGEIAGAIAVVVTLFYLANQIKHARLQQKLESHRAMAELQIGVNRIFYDLDNIKAVHSAMYDWDAADDAARVISSQWIMDMTTHYQTLYQMWISGTIDNEFWEAELRFLAAEVLPSNGGKIWWCKYKHLFSDSFVATLDREIGEHSTMFATEKSPYLTN